MVLNKNGIANLLSVRLLEAEGYKIEYKTRGYWTVTTPNVGPFAGGRRIQDWVQDQGWLDSVIIFQRESEGVIQGYPYIQADDPKGVALLQTTIRQAYDVAYERYSKKEVEGSILSQQVQARLGYPLFIILHQVNYS
jgi:hypothetical protein